VIDAPKFNIGDLVYHRTEDTPGIVIAMIYRPAGMLYQVVWQGRVTEDHYEVELTTEKPFFVISGADTEQA
jgi:hypothetical protein